MSKTYNNQLIKAAAAGGNEEVRRFIPLADACNNEALKAAIHNHNSVCVEMLLPVSDLSDVVEINGLLLWAVESLDAACVKLLIPVCNPKFNDSYPLQVAVLRGYTNILDALFDASEPRAALKCLQNFVESLGGGGEIEQRVAQFQERIEKCESQQQNKVLSEEVGGANNPVKCKQKM